MSMRLLRHVALTLGFCACFAIPSHANSPALDSLAAQLTQVADTHVECFPPNDTYAGFVVLESADQAVTWEWTDHTIYLAGDDCGALQNALTPGARSVRWLRTFDGAVTVGQAFMHLAHEVTHVRLLSVDEGLVECTAYRNVWNDLDALHLTWKIKQAVYLGAKYNHLALPTTGADAEYRSVC